MASLRVHPDRLEIQLSAAEKALALRRDEISVPRSAIRSVTITDDPWIWIRGIRAPGALIPLVLAIGTWKFHGGKDFLIIKNKRQAVIIDIADEEYARIIVSTNHAVDLVDTLNVGGEAAEAADAEAKPRAAGGTKAGVKPTAKPAAKPRRKSVVTPKLADVVAPAEEPTAMDPIPAESGPVGSNTAAPRAKKPRTARAARATPAVDPA